VLGNPGIDCDAGYVSVAHFDQLLTFEHSAGYDTWAPAPWMTAQSPARFVNAIHARHDAAGMRALGNPASGGAALVFAPRPFARTLRVFDTAGRERRALALPAGASSARWDGRDDAGTPATAGVYFAHLAGKRGAVRLALLR
jgi:hypothetical protein